MSGKSASKERASGSRSGSDGAVADVRSAAKSDSARPDAERSGKSRAEDIALVCGLTEDGQGVEIIRKRGDRLESGTVRRLEAGKPIHGEVVRLRPRPQAPMVCDVEVEFAGPERDAAQGRDEAPASGASSGPAQVATERYRKNWDAIYGRSRKTSLLN